MRSLAASFALMTGLLVLDQVPKFWVRAAMPLRETMVLIPNLLDFTHVENRGVSFSVLGGLADSLRIPLLVSFSSVAVIVLGYYWLKHREEMGRFMEWAFLLILPGAVGNLIDRAFFGTVTDFFHFRFYDTSFFVNNVADILISLGVTSYLIGSLRRSRQENL